MIDVKDFKRYLIKNPEKLQKVLEHFKFHDFSQKNYYLMCSMPDSEDVKSVTIDLNTLYCNISTESDFKGDLFEMLIFLNSDFESGFQWDLYRMLRYINDEILQITSNDMI